MVPIEFQVKDRTINIGSFSKGLKALDYHITDPGFQTLARDSVVEHRIPGFRGIHVRLKLGDITAERARRLAHGSKHRIPCGCAFEW